MKTTFKVLVFTMIAFTISCGEKEKQADAPMVEETPAIEAASDAYAEIVEASLDKFAALDYAGMMENLTDDVEWLWPNGTAATRSVIKGKDSLMAFWQNYEAMSGLKAMKFTNRSLMPLTMNNASNYYNVTGTVVLYYGDIDTMYESDTVSVRQHIVYAFDDNMKINRMFLYYDRSDWMAMSGTVIE